MKPILILLLLAVVSGSVWGQEYPYGFPKDSMLVMSIGQIKEIVRAEIERWHNNQDSIRLVDSVLKANYPLEHYFPHPEPLKIALDTVKVDTVGWNSIKSSRWDKANGGGVYSNGWKFYPVLKYTVDTLYDLTPEQIRRLKE